MKWPVRVCKIFRGRQCCFTMHRLYFGGLPRYVDNKYIWLLIVSFIFSSNSAICSLLINTSFVYSE